MGILSDLYDQTRLHEGNKSEESEKPVEKTAVDETKCNDKKEDKK